MLVLINPFTKSVMTKLFIAFMAIVLINYTFYTLQEYTGMIRWSQNPSFNRASYLTSMIGNNARNGAGYLVWSPSCRIPDIDPFHESIQKYIKKVTLPSCGKQLSHVRRVGDDHVLTVDDKSIACCYALISRQDLPRNTTESKPDDVYTIGRCIDFKHNVTFSKEEQFLKVSCTKQGIFGRRKAYTNMHSFIRKTKAVKTKLQNKTANEDRFSVMLFGIDSISRLNLFRTMPRTVDYISKQGWLNLKGYNKVDDNTFPNLVAILTGYSLEHLRATCWRQNKTIGECPFIWKDYSRKGYVTLYAEDEPKIGTFNYYMRGFVSSPTDYYLRPFMLAAETLPLVKKDALKICMGPTSTADRMIDYALEFVETFRHDPFFGLFWMNNFSHENVNTPSAMDDRILKFFKDLEKTGGLNNTIVLFLSDHGIRFGPIRETYVGWIEERLPFIYFWVPEAFKKKFPERYQSLKTNADRLTSTYDVHVTLQELLGAEINGTKACPKCQSLFKDVPWDRSCADAGITEHWCTCAHYKMLSTESRPARNIAHFVVHHLNDILREGKSHLASGTNCATLALSKIMSIRSKVFSKKFGSQGEYVILFETRPGAALFEATVGLKNTFQIMGTVSRVNSYAGQSNCINNSFLQKYCFCQKEGKV